MRFSRSFALLASLWIGGISQATLVPGFVPVAGLGTGVPYPAAALAADPNLALYATYDLQVTVGAGERWSFGSIQTSTTNTAAGVGAIPATFYAPPTNSGSVDRDFPQATVYDIASSRNFLFDTWVNIIASAPDIDGNYWIGGPTVPNFAILGGGDYPAPHPGPAIMPRTAANPSAAGGTDLARHTVDITWGDQQAINNNYPNPGTYTIARLTFDYTAGGSWILGHIGGTQHNFTDEKFAFQIPPVPEPANLAVLTVAACLLKRPRHSEPQT
jgi:hypothetical protein